MAGMDGEKGCSLKTERRRGVKIEIVVPGEVGRILKEGAKRVSETIDVFKPEVVVVLLRSGALAVEVLEGYRQEGLDHRVDVNIGRELVKHIYGEDEEEPRLYLTSGGSGPLADWQIADGEQYVTRLEESFEAGNQAIKLIIDKLRGGRETKGDQSTRIMIIDDCVNQGATLKLVAPFFARKVWGDDIRLSLQYLSEDGDWLTKIVESSFPIDNLARQMTRREKEIEVYKELIKIFLLDLAKGVSKKEGQLMEINEDNLGGIGASIARQRGENYGLSLKNPADILLSTYGIEELIGLHQRMRFGLGRIGIS